MRRPQAVARRLEQRVCAQHGRELMGCKSPVGVPTWTQHESKTTTSRRQGRNREGSSKGGRCARGAKRRAENEVSAKTYSYSSYVAAKPHARPRDAMAKLAHDSEAHRYAPCRPRRATGPALRQAQTVHWTVCVRAQPTVNAALVHRQFAHLPQGDLHRGRCV